MCKVHFFSLLIMNQISSINYRKDIFFMSRIYAYVNKIKTFTYETNSKQARFTKGFTNIYTAYKSRNKKCNVELCKQDLNRATGA